MPPILVITGPTAGGKSRLAFETAQKNDSIIINSDSMQIFAEIPVLTAQPSKIEMEQVNHFLYGILSPLSENNVMEWIDLARKLINQYYGTKKIIIIGGTGMYLKSLIYGISKMPEISEEVRSKTRDLLQERTVHELHIELEKLDPEAASKIKPNDKQRILRALEIYFETKKPISFFQKQEKIKFFDEDMFEKMILMPEREILYKRCNERFEQMLKEDVVQEVKNLKNKIGSSKRKYQSTTSIGFAEISSYLDGKKSFEEMKDLVKQKTRNYAKRQSTWFKNQFKDWKYISS